MERGLEGGCANVGMADVLAEIETSSGRRITNASIYGRIWATQADFHKDLLLEAAAEFPSGEEAASRAAAATIVASSAASGDRLLREICRSVGAAHLDALSASRTWQTWLAIWALTVATPSLEDDVERGPTLAQHHSLAVAAFSDVLVEVLDSVGAVMRSELTVEQLSMAIYALSEGLVLHQRFSPEHLVSVDIDGENWTLFAVAMEGIIARFVQFEVTANAMSGN